MKEYNILRSSENPDWASVPALTIGHPYQQTPEGIRAYAQICYTDQALLIHLRACVPEIRAVENGPLGMPCEDSCLEFFFCPMENDPRYFNLEFNSNKCMYLGFGSCIDDLTRLVPDEAEAIFQPCPRKTEDGWEIFYRIPYAFVCRFFPDFSPAPGKTIRANCYSCADLTQPAHYLSWSPVMGDSFTFHRPESFGLMTFSNY